MKGRTALLAGLALVGFAGNSVLCRLALAAREIDAAAFTAVRLVTGAIVLCVLAWSRRAAAPPAKESVVSALALFAYAAPFSYAYLRLATGTGALVLFGVVQVTMIGWGIARGERPLPLVWLGLVLALGGLVVLTAPGATAPDPLAAIAMAVAGAMWGTYSLRGRGVKADPLVATARNFAWSTPLAAVLVGVSYGVHGVSASARGVALAAASGAITSGIGYSLWYAALRALSATRAAVLQLLVPILASAFGIVLLGESVSARLAAATALILGGVGLALRGRA